MCDLHMASQPFNSWGSVMAQQTFQTVIHALFAEAQISEISSTFSSLSLFLSSDKSFLCYHVPLLVIGHQLVDPAFETVSQLVLRAQMKIRH